jgi:hypothetical protein
MTTSPIPYGARTFQIDFDFIDHKLVIQTSDGAARTIPLRSISVADFYGEVMTALRELDVKVNIHTKPNEVAEPILFEQDHTHSSYDANYVSRLRRVLVQSDRVMKEFRSRFIGKCSPVHFFWGSFDLAVTRFSGRPAPEHPGGVPNLPDSVTREAYSHEVSSCGFWPGGGAMEPAFYAYAYPEPQGFKDYPVRPSAAFYSPDMREFILPYDALRQEGNPDESLLEFFHSTYEAAANLGKWNRAELERMHKKPK